MFLYKKAKYTNIFYIKLLKEYCIREKSWDLNLYEYNY